MYNQKTLITAFLWLACYFLKANNIQISSAVLVGQDVSAGANNLANSALVQFNLSWQNSWRVSGFPKNWDAAWIFVKYRRSGGTWQHAWLDSGGHVPAIGSRIDVGLLNPDSAFHRTNNPALGVFLYRNAAGGGDVSYNQVRLKWNFGAQGVPDSAVVEFRIFAVEMVYVAGGAFSLGDATTTSIQGQFRNANANTPFKITGEGSITLGGTAAGNLGNNNATGMSPVDDFNNTSTQTLPAAFPKGFSPFYCMKYEISQGQYRDFLNCLSYSQQATRTSVAPNSAVGTGALNSFNNFRSGLEIQQSGVSSSTPALYGCNLNNDGFFNSAVDGEWIACNYLSWMDVAAYLDWAALRPMTELEYEKAARGFLSAVNGEYSWGTTSIVAANNITSSGTSGEYSATISANAVCSNQANVSGPMRVGGFSFVSNKRFLAGAGWWGICELSGNVWERTVMVGSATGRSYTGMHGNGSLTATGNANVTSWPGLSSGEVSGAAGAGFRGGGWNSAFTQCRTSSRIDAASPASTRIAASGGRGVRSAR